VIPSTAATLAQLRAAVAWLPGAPESARATVRTAVERQGAALLATCPLEHRDEVCALLGGLAANDTDAIPGVLVASYSGVLAQPVPCRLPWAQLLARLEAPDVNEGYPDPRSGKLRSTGRLICPAEFDGQGRAADNVLRVTQFWVDVDEGTRSDFDRILATLDSRGLAYAWYSTFSWEGGDDPFKARIVIPLAAPVPGKQWKSWRTSTLRELGIENADPQTSDPSRLYWLPAHRPGAPYEHGHRGGAVLPVSTGGAPAAEEAPEGGAAPDLDAIPDAAELTCPAGRTVLEHAERLARSMRPSTGIGQGSGAACLNFLRALLWGLEIPWEQAEPIFAIWNARCTREDGTPWPWSGAELEHKIADALSDREAPYARGSKRPREIGTPYTAVPISKMAARWQRTAKQPLAPTLRALAEKLPLDASKVPELIRAIRGEKHPPTRASLREFLEQSIAVTPGYAIEQADAELDRVYAPGWRPPTPAARRKRASGSFEHFDSDTPEAATARWQRHLKQIARDAGSAPLFTIRELYDCRCPIGADLADWAEALLARQIEWPPFVGDAFPRLFAPEGDSIEERALDAAKSLLGRLLQLLWGFDLPEAVALALLDKHRGPWTLEQLREADEPLPVEPRVLQLPRGSLRALPRVVNFDKLYWVRPHDSETFGKPIQASALTVHLDNSFRHCCPEVTPEDGGPRRLLPVQVAEYRIVYHRPDTTFEAREVPNPDGSTRIEPTLIQGLRSCVAPIYHAEVAEWMQALAGAQVDRLCGWIAGCGQSLLDKPWKALLIFGATRIGKSLLAHGLAAIYGHVSAISQKDAESHFNAELATNPFELVDEHFIKDYTTDQFRTQISSLSHTCEQKFMPRTTIESAIRMICAFQAKEDFAFSDAPGRADLDAIERRCFFIECPEAANQAAEQALARLGILEDKHAARRKIAEHFLWIQQNVEPWGALEEHDEGTNNLLSQICYDKEPELWQLFADWLRDSDTFEARYQLRPPNVAPYDLRRPDPSAFEDYPLGMYDGRVYCRPIVLAAIKGWPLDRIHKALAPAVVNKRLTVHIGTGKERRTFQAWGLDGAQLSLALANLVAEPAAGGES